MVEQCLPFELERVIFEMAFNPDDLASNTDMTLVARRVREWVRPMIYSVFFQEGAFNTLNLDHFPDFQHYHSLNAEELGKFAKHLYIGSPWKGSRSSVEESIRKLVQQCPNVENLACWYSIDDPRVTLAPIFEDSSKLRRLSIDCFRQTAVTEGDDQRLRDMWINLNSRYLTHLDLMNCPQNWPFGAFATYPKLTHFSAYSPIEWTKNTIRPILECCPVLQVFILAFKGFKWDLFGNPEDLRVVLLDDDLLSSEDWLEGAKGRFNSWTFAERIVHARKSKYFIEGTNFWEVISQSFDWDAHLTPDGKKWYSTLSK
ncbi:hypothetical protein BJ165DRAFT_1001916 [Panaeolus papilionaceus]|nr:hypothetical protein BJ165DRAFT_1001916 [Panaeolus papilionaceus]